MKTPVYYINVGYEGVRISFTRVTGSLNTLPRFRHVRVRYMRVRFYEILLQKRALCVCETRVEQLLRVYSAYLACQGRNINVRPAHASVTC